MRLTSDWITAPRSQLVLRVAGGAAGPALFVGGSVRNAVQGRPIGDLDIATPALPETVMAQAKAAGLKAIPTGLDHGTVTIVAQGVAHEVTTFRRDVRTTGRHATVAFSHDIAQDAARRDFTMNALYAGADGQVIDPLGGLPDALAGRVRFIGDATARIAEDYLRILRFFRFTAIYASGPADTEGLAACAASRDGISRLSVERVTGEMCKLLQAPAPARAVAEMDAAGILQSVLPGAQPQHLPPLQRAEAALDAAPRWRRRLLALGGDSSGWRLSNADRKALTQAQQMLGTPATTAERAYRAGADLALDAALVEAAWADAMPAADLRRDCDRGARARFPLAAADLMPPYRPGSALGAELRRLEEHWIRRDFTPDRAALLDAMRPPPDLP